MNFFKQCVLVCVCVSIIAALLCGRLLQEEFWDGVGLFLTILVFFYFSESGFISWDSLPYRIVDGSFIHSFIYSFIQHTGIQCHLCARLCAR